MGNMTRGNELNRFWEWVVRINNPSPDVTTYNNARLLAGLLGALLIAGAAALLITGYYIGVSIDNLISWAGLGILFLIYLVNRSGRFRAASLAGILFITAITLLVSLLVGEAITLFLYILLPIFIALILFESRQAVFTAVGILLLTAVLMTLFQSPPQFYDRLNIIIYAAMMAALFAVLIHHIRRVEALRQRRVEQLRGRSEELEALNREIEQFTYVAAHDLKSPLRGIANLAQWIEEDLNGAAVTPELQRYFQLLHGRVSRMETIIDGLRHYAQVDKREAYKEMVNITQLVEEVFRRTEPPAQFSLTVQSELPDFIAEKAHLEQIFFQLLDNAVRHHHRQEGQITVSARAAGGFYHFAVTDDGPGIDPRYHAKAFAIFQTLQSRDARESVGIGLPLIKKLIEARGGAIHLRSNVGQGSAIYFTWPAQFAGDANGAAVASGSQPESKEAT
jgi:signal transduction histidine kinase